MANQGILDIESSQTKVDQVNKELPIEDHGWKTEEEGQSEGEQHDASLNSEEECHVEDVYTGISP